MKKVLVFSVIVLLLLGISVFGENIKYGGTLRVVNAIGGNLVPNFNPFSPSAVSILPVIYETLFSVNILNGDIVPILGTSYKWEDNDLKLIITTRNGVKWSDGTPFTAKDVAFTFNYLKENPALDQSGIWSPLSSLQSVEASGDNRVVFTFLKQNTPVFFYIVEQSIIPAHIWSDVEDPSTWTNPNPVGTGPFEIESINVPNNTLTLTKNPNYWMKDKPYIDKISYTAVLSNTTAFEMLLSDKADMVGAFLPNIQKAWADKNPSLNKYWWPVYDTNVLLFNTLKYPFDNPTFRKAIALSIDKNSLEEKAYYNVGGVANQLGIVPTQLDEWLDPTLKDLLNSFTYDPATAQKLLESAGFKKNTQGQLCDLSGKPFPTFKILVPAGATDFITMAQIISENLKAIGLSTVIDQEAGNTYMSSVMSGTYEMAVCWGTGFGPTPYYFYYGEFNPFFSAPIGQMAISDYGRYTNPLITSALDVYSQTSDINLQKQSIYTIERIFLMDTPFVPLTNRTMFGEWSESRFTGWPSDSNPYCGYSEFGYAGGLSAGELIALNVHLK